MDGKIDSRSASRFVVNWPTWGGSLPWPLFVSKRIGSRTDECKTAQRNKDKARKKVAHEEQKNKTKSSSILISVPDLDRRYTGTIYATPENAEIHVYSKEYGTIPYMSLQLSCQCTVDVLLQKVLERYHGSRSQDNQNTERKFAAFKEYVLCRGQLGLYGATQTKGATGKPDILQGTSPIYDLLPAPVIVIFDQGPKLKLLTMETYCRDVISKNCLESAEEKFRQYKQNVWLGILQKLHALIRDKSETFRGMIEDRRRVTNDEYESRRSVWEMEILSRGCLEKLKRRAEFSLLVKEDNDAALEVFIVQILCLVPGISSLQIELVVFRNASAADVRQDVWKVLLASTGDGKPSDKWPTKSVNHYALVSLLSANTPNVEFGKPMKLLLPLKDQIQPNCQVGFVLLPLHGLNLRVSSESRYYSRCRQYDHLRETLRRLRLELLVQGTSLKLAYVESRRRFVLSMMQLEAWETLSRYMMQEKHIQWKVSIHSGFQAWGRDIELRSYMPPSPLLSLPLEHTEYAPAEENENSSKKEKTKAKPGKSRIVISSVTHWPPMEEDTIDKGFMLPLISPILLNPASAKAKSH